jgi:hypothetical protein
MRRALIAAMLTTLAALCLPSPAGAFDRPPGDDDIPDAEAAPHDVPCFTPVPTFTYDDVGLVYGVEVDYAGCEWWEGGPIELSASLERFNGLDDEGVGTGVICGVPAYVDDPATDDDTDALDDGKFEAAGRSCSVSVGMEHPPVEVGRYRGELSWPWKDGTVTASFEAVCVATPLGGHCKEVHAAGL